MRARRWALALTAFGTVGASAMVVGLPNSASADDNRYNVSARGDAFYFEVNGDDIPVSPQNDAGSLTASAETTNAGGSKGFAGMPYWGNSVQYAPGTVNGVPNQFGLGQVQIPFAVLPGYVESSSYENPSAEQDFGYGRVKSTSTETAATSSAQYGAPPTVPSPNQQQTANASTESKGNAVTAVASGSSSGFVSGPLEVGNSTALASITQSVGKPAKIESKSFGRFSVNGQEFGFDQNGFRYAGQAKDSKEAIAQANTALKNAGIQIDLAPVITEKDESGKTFYTIGGLLISSTQATPSGGHFTVTYILGRAKVGAVVATLGLSSAGSSTSAGVDNSGDVSTDTTDPGTAASGLAAAALSPDLAAEAAGVPANVATITDSGAVTPVSGGTAELTGQQLPRRLGFVPVAGQSGNNSEWLYAMLLLAGAVVLGGHFLFSRFAVAAKGA
ncbi:MAG TPA: hypothetical protein VMZ00_15285 [Sporichthya sp.]|nr:hypothetical protein [Sporichthya sp.]